VVLPIALARSPPSPILLWYSLSFYGGRAKSTGSLRAEMANIKKATQAALVIR
jgi:hypothetical protein